MNRRTELLVYMGATLATIAGLFTLQAWYATYIDVSVLHGDHSDVGLNPGVVATREAEKAKLSSGRMPIESAKKLLATSGREAAAKVAPKASDDLSAMSGWVYRPGFAPYEPRKPRAAASETPATPATPAAPATEHTP